jgi:hypothetical protein
MFLCQWELDIVFGKQKQALDTIKAWGEEKMRSSNFSRSSGGRVYVGYIGTSAAHIVDEYVFEKLDDFEKALADMAKPEFKKFAEAMAPLIVSGTQKWTIWKILA